VSANAVFGVPDPLSTSSRLPTARLWLVGALVGLLSLGGCSEGRQRQTLRLQGETMGTTWSVQVVEPPADLDSAALESRIRTRLDAVNAQMSTYDPDSELSRFNRTSSRDWLPVSAGLAKVVALASEISGLSSGAFDVTVGPLVNLWGFGPGAVRADLPSKGDVDDALARVGHEHLAVRQSKPALRKSTTGLYVDLSAIAKGYGVDELVGVLESLGLTDYLVEIGGELRGRGLNATGQPWRIAIERPDAGVREVFAVVPLRDLAMATSGDYRNFFEVDGQHYSHTIDPSTGWPVRHRLASVTVLDGSCARADALATALLVLGPDRGLELAERLGIAAMLILREDDGYRTIASRAFEVAVGGD
jgi:thiamine biosynthesis lipoprotein